MSLTLEIRGNTVAHWPLSDQCLSQIERLRRAEDGRAIDAIMGGPDSHAGESRNVTKSALIAAVTVLLPIARRTSAGFRVRVPPQCGGTESAIGRGIGGVQLEGRHHFIYCWPDHWTIQAIDELRQGKQPVRQYEPAEIITENMGVIRVERTKPRRSDLVKLLTEIKGFLATGQSEYLIVTWG